MVVTGHGNFYSSRRLGISPVFYNICSVIRKKIRIKVHVVFTSYNSTQGTSFHMMQCFLKLATQFHAEEMISEDWLT